MDAEMANLAIKHIMERTRAIERSPQYWVTTCLVCDKAQFSAVEHMICSQCEETSAVTDYIVKLEAVILAGAK
jgi:hypothetical protein